MAFQRRWTLATFATGLVSGALFGQVPDLVTSPMPFIGITPCRIADTRDAGKPPGYGPPSLAAGQPRDFVLAGQCGIPSGAQAVSLNVTVVNAQGFGFIRLWPEGGDQPAVSTLNFAQGMTVANAAVVPLGDAGGITVAAGVSGTDFIIDTNGYFGATAGGYFSTFLGAGNATMTDDYNTGAGIEALHSNAAGAFNTALGWFALRDNTDGSSNTAAGQEAMRISSVGSENTALGSFSLHGNTSGSGNTAVGSYALRYLGGGNYNTAVGLWALGDLTSGTANIAFPSSSGQHVQSGNSNIYLNALEAPASESVTTRIGNAGSTDRAFVGGIRGAALNASILQVYVDPVGQFATMVSSRRYKEDIRNVGDSSSRLLELRPVTFRYRDVEGDRTHFGLIAEEVERVFPELVALDDEGLPLSIRYTELPSLLLEELRRQQTGIEVQDAEAARLEQRALDLNRRAEEVARRLGRLRANSGADAGPSHDSSPEVKP